MTLIKGTQNIVNLFLNLYVQYLIIYFIITCFYFDCFIKIKYSRINKHFVDFTNGIVFNYSKLVCLFC